MQQGVHLSCLDWGPEWVVSKDIVWWQDLWGDGGGRTIEKEKIPALARLPM